MSNEIQIVVTIRRATTQAVEILCDRHGEGDDVVALRADDFEQCIKAKFHELREALGGETYSQEERK